MKITIARQDTYIPKWRGNRKLKEEEQIKVDYSFMTAEQEEKFSTVTPRYSNEGNDETHAKFEIEIHTRANEIWLECVKKVSGLFWEEKEITAPQKVLEIPGIYGLITEVVGHIKAGIDEEESKNS